MNQEYLSRAERQEYLDTCPIQELNGLRFLVPPYQRGYRWTELQVKQLLDDIATFDTASAAFYCLQPIVVRRRASGEGWELIDGQQRLTTIWLIQRLIGGQEYGYSLEFETATRKVISQRTLEDAVAEPPLPLAADAPLEANYIRAAAETIRQWKTTHEATLADFRSKLLTETRVIWYETAAPDSEAQTIFSRLNAGKIPLTNAELIKALLLKQRAGAANSSAEQARRLEIAADWNHIEAALAQPAFWGWLRQSADTAGRPRIEWLLRLVQQQQQAKTAVAEAQPLALFQAVEQELQGNDAAVWTYWQRVRREFLHLHGWFEDHDFYHRVGYLLATGARLPDLLALRAVASAPGRGTAATAAQMPSKTALLDSLKQHIEERAGFADGDPDEEWNGLQYGPDTYLINKILLLHNVATAWQARSTNGRFPFDLYFTQRHWSLEHIHPQNPRDATADDSRRWLESLQSFLDKQPTATLATTFLPKIREALALYVPNGNPEAAAFGQAANDIRQEYLPHVTDFEAAETASDASGPNPLHALSNLALLAGSDNTALSNAAFPEKRDKVLAWHHEGHKFVPPATLNVFLKMHSTQADDLRRWTSTDRNDYQEAMRQNVLAFLKTPAPTPVENF